MECPICNNSVAEFHKRSHLIPEWMYTNCYDERHKILEIRANISSKKKRQKGIYASFMCEGCESTSQLYDHYASLVLTDKSPNSSEYLGIQKDIFKNYSYGEEIEYSIWKGIDFNKFQKFVFGVVLRSHFSGNMEGQHSLNQKHLGKIKNIFETENSTNDSSYPILVAAYHPNYLNNHVVIPFLRKIKGIMQLNSQVQVICFTFLSLVTPSQVLLI